MEPLNFASLDFRGADRVEPPNFDVNVQKYTVVRKAGNNKLAFRAGVNRSAGGIQGYTLVLYVYGDMYSKSYWSPDSWTPFRVGPEETEVVIGCELDSLVEGEKSQYITLTVRTEPISEEEREACVHPSCYTSEGQCWGGGSGSSTVEIITSCSVCNATLSTSHEHRD